MAQIKVHPHRQPARHLNHISQAWKDSSRSPQDTLKMCEQQVGTWNAGKGEKKETERDLQLLFFLFETKAKTFYLHAATLAVSLINPMCSCLWGVKSEGSCPLWPRGSAERCRVEGPRDPTALSHQITRCIYSVGLKFKVRTPTFHKMPVFTVPWIVCKFSVVNVCWDACPWKCYRAFTLKIDTVQLHSLPSGVLWNGVIKNLPLYNKFLTDKRKKTTTLNVPVSEV